MDGHRDGDLLPDPQAHGGGRDDGTGTERIFGYHHSAGYSSYPRLGWAVVSSRVRSEALASAGALAKRSMIVAAIATALMLLVAVLFSGAIKRGSRPSAELATVAEASSASSEQVSAAAEQTSAPTQEIAASAQSLASTAEQLEQLVGRFRLEVY